MTLVKKNYYLFAGVSLGIVFVLILQVLWLHHAYMETRRQLMVQLEDAFDQAYRKEQTYRVPVVDIVNPGAVTIESCGTEEIQIIRKCPIPDTIVYKNPSGHSIESFISRVFVDLREHIVPMNINCLADLFGGMLHDKGIPAYFVIERFDVVTGKVLDTSLLPDKKQPKTNPETTIFLEISEKESLRAILQITPGIVFGQIRGILVLTISISIILIICILIIYSFTYTEKEIVVNLRKTLEMPELNDKKEVFSIGHYSFDPAKNELHGYGESVQLNKKENAILYALCVHCGNVVERGILLTENWGSSGEIYSRSLDTYITALRKYLKKDPSIQIVTIKGVGYKIVR